MMDETDKKVSDLIDFSYANRGKVVTLEEFEREYDRKHHIFCPHCGTRQSQETMYENCVSYWGEEAEAELNCEHCDEEFIVKEIVDRTFEIRKKEDEEQ